MIMNYKKHWQILDNRLRLIERQCRDSQARTFGNRYTCIVLLANVNTIRVSFNFFTVLNGRKKIVIDKIEHL